MCACARAHAGMQKPLSNPFRPAASRSLKPSCEADEFARSAVSETNFHHAEISARMIWTSSTTESSKGDAVRGQVFPGGIGLKRDSSSCLFRILLYQFGFFFHAFGGIRGSRILFHTDVSFKGD